MNDDVLISIICNTYNHESYIADALESFLAQKTNFKYEILIHDDASTDNTAKIIRKYEKRFPDIIKPIYQKTNQYSKGIRVGLVNSERAAGKYIALCEGDDYWTSPLKLQEQVDYLESHPECSVCVHASLMIDANTKDIIGETRPSKNDRNFSIEEVITGGGNLFATNSMIYKRDLGNIRPDFYYKSKFSFTDYQLLILLALTGQIHYIDKFMSVYRYNVPGSWTVRNLNQLDKNIQHFKEVNSMLDEVNNYTKGKYSYTINKTKLRNEFNVLLLQGNYKQIKNIEYRDIYDNLNKLQKIEIMLQHYYPKIAGILKILKRKFKVWILKSKNQKFFHPSSGNY